MTWTKLSDDFADRPAMLACSRGARLLYVEGLLYSAKHLLDGRLPSAALARLGDEPNPKRAAEQLVAAGLWSETDDGWQIVDYLEDQESREQVEKRRELERQKKERARRHKAGDHSLCLRGNYCPQGELTPGSAPRPDQGTSPASSPGLSLVASPGESPHSRPDPSQDPSRPGPTEGQGKGRAEGKAAAAAAPLTRCDHGKPKSSFCSLCVPNPHVPIGAHP